jgi:hypothetical protein
VNHAAFEIHPESATGITCTSHLSVHRIGERDLDIIGQVDRGSFVGREGIGHGRPNFARLGVKMLVANAIAFLLSESQSILDPTSRFASRVNE